MESCAGFVQMLRKKARKNALLILIMVGVILGFVIGILMNSHVQSSRYDDEERRKIVMLTSFLGDIFIRLLKLLIIPLIITSIVTAVASLDTKTTGKIGRRTFIYFFLTTFIAVIVGIILVVSIRPGDTAVQSGNEEATHVSDPLISILDLVRNLFPDNLVETTFRTASTTYKDKVTSLTNSTLIAEDIKNTIENLTNFMENKIYDPWTVNHGTKNVRVITKTTKKVWEKVEKAERMNVLGLITCSITFGIALSTLGDEGRPLRDLFEILFKIVMSLINGVMWLSPVGVCSLIAGRLVEMEDVTKTFESLAFLIVTTITAVAIQILIVYPLIFFISLRKNPFRFLFNLQAAMLTAFGTCSSAATIPVIIKCATEKNKVDPRVAQFVLPIGATVNMDGTAIYETVACIYIAQLNGYSFGIGKILITAFTTLAASVGAGVPSASLVTILMVLEATGLPTSDVGLLYSIDWLLDRFCTVCNITGDGIAAAIIEKFSSGDFGDDIKPEGQQENSLASGTLSSKDGAIVCTNFRAHEVVEMDE